MLTTPSLSFEVRSPLPPLPIPPPVEVYHTHGDFSAGAGQGNHTKKGGCKFSTSHRSIRKVSLANWERCVFVCCYALGQTGFGVLKKGRIAFYTNYTSRGGNQ